MQHRLYQVLGVQATISIMENNIQNAVSAITNNNYGKPEKEFLVRIVGVEYSAIEAKMIFHTSKMDKMEINKKNPYIKEGGYELFLLRNRDYRAYHLGRAADMVRAAIDSEFPKPTDNDVNGIGYVNYCRKMIKVINEQLEAGTPVVCWMELAPFDKKLSGYGMKKGIQQKATFKPLDADTSDAVNSES